jgi:hypothetical protein
VSTGGRLRSGLTAAAALLLFATRVLAQEAAPPAPGIMPEPRPLARIGEIVERRTSTQKEPSNGFFVDFGSAMITGSGWIAAGPGYRHRILGNRATFTASAVLSWRLYSAAQVRIDAPTLLHGHASAGAQALYQDSLQVNYFGLGNRSRLDDRTGFRLRTTDLTVYGNWKPTPHLSVDGRAGWLGDAHVSRMRGRDPGYPDTQDLFTDATAPGLSTTLDFLHADASVAIDTRDEIADTSRGGYVRASIARYSDRHTGHFTFSTYELEGADYVTLLPDKIILAAHAWIATTSADPTHEIPFYLMPNVGGQNTLRGYADYRYFDREMENIGTELRFRVYAHLELAGFLDAGKVSPHLRGLGLTDLHSNGGFGVRFHTRSTTVGRLDIGTGSEGWYAVFKMSEPFHRKKGSGGFTTVAPFVP